MKESASFDKKLREQIVASPELPDDFRRRVWSKIPDETDDTLIGWLFEGTAFRVLSPRKFLLTYGVVILLVSGAVGVWLGTEETKVGPSQTTCLFTSMQVKPQAVFFDDLKLGRW